MNILVGPNNSGKSTILGAFQALAAGIRLARAKSPVRVYGTGNIADFGYHIPEESFPMSVENIHTDYAETDTTIDFRLSNGNKLQLFFPVDGGSILIPQADGRSIRSPKQFREAFPITITSIPILGLIEHEEDLYKEETVKRGLATHRASRHFRNFWHYYPDGFDDFAALVGKTWPGMAIEAPRMLDSMSAKLTMFCYENRIARELFWSGFGFQIWCQLLTHISRAGNDTYLIVDEPEVYLHPDIQRQLLGILRECGPDIILATHSTEIMGEADPSEIVLIDKTRKASERLRDAVGVQGVLNAVGSIHNITLTQLARNKRLIYVNDLDDFVLLRRFAGAAGLSGLATGAGLTPLKSDVFSSWEDVVSFVRGVKKAIGNSVLIGAIYDRSYSSQEEIDAITTKLDETLSIVHVLARKEIENYLLVPDVLERAFQKALQEKSERTGEEVTSVESITSILERLTESLHQDVLAQYTAKRAGYHSGLEIDPATLTIDTARWFESKWQNVETRLEIVPGKELLRNLRDHIETEYGVILSDYRIVHEFSKEEMPAELMSLLERLDDFRRGE
jgi:energy-coupling factor transporter ATP-binding protein EcfA2